MRPLARRHPWAAKASSLRSGSASRLLPWVLAFAAAPLWFDVPRGVRAGPWGHCRTKGLPEAKARSVDLTPEVSADLTALVQDAARRSLFESAVLGVVRRGKVVYRRAFGRARPDSIFDLASLTKVVATTPAIMKLVQGHKLSLADRIDKHLPWLAGTPIASVTIRQLLLHTAGLPSVVWAGPRPQGPRRQLSNERNAILQRLRAARLVSRPGVRYRYSDVGFILLGLVVEAVAGKTLARYAHEAFFAPLGMCDTGFVPPRDRWLRTISPWPDGGNIGVVYDPLAARMQGIAGHSGLFASAEDLLLFGQMLVAEGAVPAGRVLTAKAVQKMTRVDQRAGPPARGLGWRIYGNAMGPLSRVRRDRQVAPFGHRGFTGTWLWIDPANEIVIVLLTDRTRHEHPRSVDPLRRLIAKVVLASRLDQPPRPVLTGLDRLAEQRFGLLRGARVALITNHTAVDHRGRFVADLLAGAPNVHLVALLSPEHGLGAAQDRVVADGVYKTSTATIPLFSLFGKRRRPTDETLRGADTIVFDVQTVGVRFYTYLATMAWAMEEAARRGLRFVVLDRPNPLGGERADGPVSSATPRTSANFFPLPIMHGMTVGELARLYNRERRIGARLTVVPLKGWRRSMRFDQQGRPWVNPSPNLRNWRQTLLYPAVGLLESTNVSVGRGTDSPFVQMGSPWIDGQHLAAALNARKLRGVHFVATRFTPKAAPYRGELCQGARLLVTDVDRFQPVQTGLHLAAALLALYPKRWNTQKLHKLIRDDPTVRALLAGRPVAQIVQLWQPGLSRFRQLRQRYLLYR